MTQTNKDDDIDKDEDIENVMENGETPPRTITMIATTMEAMARTRAITRTTT